MNSNVEDLAAYFAEDASINVPALHEDAMSADQGEVRVAGRDFGRDYVRTGTRISVQIPFDGDEAMFQIRPSTFDSMPPRGTVSSGVLTFAYDSMDATEDQVRAEWQGWLASVQRYLGRQRQDLAGFNTELVNIARDAINERRAKLLNDRKLVGALGLPLKRRDDAPAIVPVARRKVAPKLPPATPGSYKPEPALELAEYEHILQIIQSMVQVMERSPTAFHSLDEEALRTHIIVPLNGQYQGQASGETFNYQGKTDILIRADDRNVFIAECKFWGGPAKLTEAIDQLLGYLSWRDSKTALLIFNRNKDFTRVLETIPPTVRAHPKFRRELAKPGETSSRYIFRHRDDDAKDLILTVMAFDVPAG